MRTHLIPYAELAVGYEGLSDEERRARVKSDYVAFIEARAELLAGAAQRTCTGQSVELSELFHEGQSTTASGFKYASPCGSIKWGHSSIGPISHRCGSSPCPPPDDDGVPVGARQRECSDQVIARDFLGKAGQPSQLSL